MITANKRTGRIKYYKKVKDSISFRAQARDYGDRERKNTAVTSARMSRPKAANKVKD